MITALKRTANTLNSRSITATWGTQGESDLDYLMPLTPNMLLIGRANSDIPIKSYEDTDLPLKRLLYVSELESAWWNQFKVQAFTSLIPSQKWTEAIQNQTKLS